MAVLHFGMLQHLENGKQLIFFAIMEPIER